jgi:hypothetical protein
VPKVKRRGIGSYLVTGILYDSLTSETEPEVGDHIHAALGMSICGTFAENAPAFETVAGSDTKAGLHSHGDGLIHIHPYTEDEAGEEATVGRFFEYGGYEVDDEHLAIWDGLTLRNGDQCPDGRPGSVRWSVNGEEQDGDPADYHPSDQDTITIGFLPDGDAIPAPPPEVLAALPNPADVQQEQQQG